MLNQMPTTNNIDIRCHNIQWAVSKYVAPAIGMRIRIRRIFSTNSIANAVIIAFVRVLGFMSAVDISSSSSR